MTITGSTRLVGLFGNPVEHTLSPALHNPAFRKLNLDYVYIPLPTPKDNIAQAVDALRVFNFVGANVTIPFKTAVLPYLDEISPVSEKIGAVNTIVNRNGHLYGTTTDPEGFINGFGEKGHSFRNKTTAIIGTGGAARTIAFTLLLQPEPGQLYISGRNTQALATLSEEIKNKTGKTITAVPLHQYGDIQKCCDIVIQSTCVGMHPNVDKSPLEVHHLEPGQILYDIVYTPEDTAIIKIARDKGLSTVGGLGMLVHQGIASFKLWTGITPEVSDFYLNIRGALSSR